MFKYLFIDGHNGHMTTYHPFLTSLHLTQKRAYEFLNSIPCAGRMGTTVNHLLDILDKQGHSIDYYECPCCGNRITEMKNPNLSEWDCIKGVDGNY